MREVVNKERGRERGLIYGRKREVIRREGEKRD